MKRIDTLKKEARKALDDDARRWTGQPINGVSMMDIARAMDKLKEAEDVLRRAFGP